MDNALSVVWSELVSGHNAERYARGHLTRDFERTLCGRHITAFWTSMSERDMESYDLEEIVHCKRCAKHIPALEAGDQ